MTTTSPPSKPKRSYNGMTAEERQTQRRERFIEAGLEVFGRKGFAAATVRDLCKEAGFTDRYYYALFSDIENLFAATFESVTTELVAALVESFQDPEEGLRLVASKALQAFYRFLKTDERRARILLVEAQIFYYSGRLHSTIKDDPYMGLLIPLLQSRYPGLAQSQLDTGYTLKTVLGMVISSAAIWYLDGMHKSVEEAVENQLFVWDGLDAWLSKVSQTSTQQAITTVDRKTC
ncbi:TetR/AcrR family transcriptional regulator [Aquabacterium sp.]|uniref:TetR/AcrR family transcriptional regulator n=1 Tax=Aquabacterium sp. TaxID=1872578 RepID=UPI003D6D7DA0